MLCTGHHAGAANKRCNPCQPGVRMLLSAVDPPREKSVIATCQLEHSGRGHTWDTCTGRNARAGKWKSLEVQCSGLLQCSLLTAGGRRKASTSAV